jgi:hypothetical protein
MRPEFQRLGRLTQVDPRTVWPGEATDLTPWLAETENLELLGETLGLELELEAQERYVGPFRADILCKDTANGSWVLIENQLEKTNHGHLGQLLTYAAGLDAVTIVWIARKFTEEHRAALDWLNRSTATEINFFGLEIEVWRITDSPPAPKFNVVSKPNDWSRQVALRAKDLDLSPLKELQYDFWDQFNELLRDSSSRVRPRSPKPDSWMTYAIGHSGFRLEAVLNSVQRRIGVNLLMRGDGAKNNFHQLLENRVRIEQQLRMSLVWDELPEKQRSAIRVVLEDADITEKTRWPEYQTWLKNQLEAFREAFGPLVTRLAANSDGEDDAIYLDEQ